MFRGLLHTLRDLLLAKVESLDQAKCAFLSFLPLLPRLDAPSYPIRRLLSMLDSTFAYISFPELRPVPLKLMRRLERVPDHFLRELAANDAFYKECPLEVKRQIWEVADAHFRTEMAPLVELFVKQHAAELKKSHPVFASGVALLDVSKKRARSNPHFTKIVDSIGGSPVRHLIFSLLSG